MVEKENDVEKAKTLGRHANKHQICKTDAEDAKWMKSRRMRRHWQTMWMEIEPNMWVRSDESANQFLRRRCYIRTVEGQTLICDNSRTGKSDGKEERREKKRKRKERRGRRDVKRPAGGGDKRKSNWNLQTGSGRENRVDKVWSVHKASDGTGIGREKSERKWRTGRQTVRAGNEIKKKKGLKRPRFAYEQRPASSESVSFFLSPCFCANLNLKNKLDFANQKKKTRKKRRKKKKKKEEKDEKRFMFKHLSDVLQLNVSTSSNAFGWMYI